MNTHVAHHYDNVADVEANVRGQIYGSKPFAALDLQNRPAGNALFFLDSASIDAFVEKLKALAVEMRQAEAAAQEAEGAVQP